MMHMDLFSDGVARIDPDAVERLLQIEQELGRRAARRRRGRILSVLAAALLSVMLVSVLLIVPFIPKTLDLDYQPSKGLPERVWVYYVNEKGAQKRELVKQPQGAQNVFTSWKHLNTVDNEVQLLDYTVTTELLDGTTVVPDTLWESLLQMLDKTGEQTIVTATLSAQITSYENYDALIKSLTETLAKYAGIDPEQVRILIDGEQVIVPDPSGSAVSRQLKFSYSFTPDYSFAALYYTPGSTIELTVSMTNVSDTDVVFHGSEMAFYPDVKLRQIKGDEVFLLRYQERETTNEYAEYRLLPGETRTTTYVFHVPENATLGAYDLTVSFGEDRVTFNQVITLANFVITDTDLYTTEFAEFLNKYGFYTTDPMQFRAAIAQLSFSGKVLFDIMTPVPSDYAEGYSGEEYGSDLFAYEYTRQPDGRCNNYFVGMAIPDDMRLPHGIAPGDRLIDSLYKMGLDTERAQRLVEQAQTLSEGERIELSEYFFSLYITRNSYGEYIIRHSSMTVLSSSNYPVYTLEIVYAAENMTFKCFCVKAGHEEFSTDMFSGPIEFDYPGNPTNFLCRLTDEHLDRVLDILKNSKLQNGTLDLAGEYQVIINGKQFGYSASEGIFCNSTVFLRLSEQDRITVNTILESYEIMVQE